MSQNVLELIVQLERDAESNQLELPSRPEIINQILVATKNSHETEISQFISIIQRDPLLATRFLKLANFSGYNKTLRFACIEQVFESLGVDVCQNIIFSLVLHQVYNVSSIRLQSRIRNLWAHSCRVAAISWLFALSTAGLEPARAILAGLLHDIGVLPILVYADQFFRDAKAAGKLDEVIGQLRGSLGLKIIQHWQLGDDLKIIADAVENIERDHDGEADYYDLVQVAHIHSQPGLRNRQGIPALSRMPAFNKLAMAKRGPHAGFDLIEQSRDEINAIIRILNG